MLFAMAVIAAGDAGKPILLWCDSLTQVMFKFAGIIMKFAPYGVGAAMAVTVGHQGLDVERDATAARGRAAGEGTRITVHLPLPALPAMPSMESST